VGGVATERVAGSNQSRTWPAPTGLNLTALAGGFNGAMTRLKINLISPIDSDLMMF